MAPKRNPKEKNSKEKPSGGKSLNFFCGKIPQLVSQPVEESPHPVLGPLEKTPSFQFLILLMLGSSAVRRCDALLPDNTEESYKELFKALLENSADHGYSFEPVSVHIDFELPVVNAAPL